MKFHFHFSYIDCEDIAYTFCEGIDALMAQVGRFFYDVDAKDRVRKWAEQTSEGDGLTSGVFHIVRAGKNPTVKAYDF